MYEKVNPKHPDKLADRIAGALVDYAYSKEENPVVISGYQFIFEDHTTLVPNENYWGGTPKLDKIVLNTFFDTDSQILAMQNGELDIIDLSNLDSAIVASYTAPLGAFEDLQDALDALVLVSDSDEDGAFADATASLSVTLRSGATVALGTGTIHWSGIINWAAFEAYAYTWADIEAAEMTWADLEGLPVPTQGV